MDELIRIADALASASAAMACWIADDCEGADDHSQDDIDQAIGDARMAIIDLAAWHRTQAGQQSLFEDPV